MKNHRFHWSILVLVLGSLISLSVLYASTARITVYESKSFSMEPRLSVLESEASSKSFSVVASASTISVLESVAKESDEASSSFVSNAVSESSGGGGGCFLTGSQL